MAPIGTHYLVELYDCPSHLLNNAIFVKQVVREASKHGLATLLDEISHEFVPHGVTVVGLLAESHIAVHTWPEYRYAAADIFTCGSTTEPVLACDWLARQFQSGRHSLTKLVRGAELLELSGSTPAEIEIGAG